MVQDEDCESRFPLFPTVNYLSKIGRDNFRSVLKENGIFQGQDEILFLILFKEGLKPSEIAKYLHTSLASISVSLKRLEKQKLLEKRSDENDARISHIYITEKGKTALTNVHSNLMCYQEKVFAEFSNDELDLFRSFLDRVIFNATGEENYSYKRPNKLKGDEENGK
ncbi:MAG: MarR family winged helix-turn-helix transcriptional regulator [Eubacterium sp.]